MGRPHSFLVIPLYSIQSIYFYFVPSLKRIALRTTHWTIATSLYAKISQAILQAP